MDSEGIGNQYDRAYGLGGESTVSSADGQNAFQDEPDVDEPDVVKLYLVDAEEEEEERTPPTTMLDVLSSGSLSEKQDSEGNGDQSGKRKQKCSEVRDNDSAVVEGDGVVDQSRKQKQKCSEKVGSSSEVVEGESSQVQRLVLTPGSGSQGVNYQIQKEFWEAHIWIKEIVIPEHKRTGVQLFLGNYRTEDEAKQAHDRVAIKLDIRESLQGKPYTLNFPESAQEDFLTEYRDWTNRDFLWLIRRLAPKFSRGKSDMKGVTVRAPVRTPVRTPVRKRLNTGEEESGPAERYSAKISRGKGQDKKSAHIGTYGSEEEAGKAYDRALLFINKDKEEKEMWSVITNFRPSSYTTAEILEAGSKLVFK